jgi:glucose/arabinose dehydrogenase
VRTVNGVSTDIHTNNPAEELNYLGDVSAPSKTWFGYPTCFTVGDPSQIKNATFKLGDQFVLAPNNTFNDKTCTQKSKPPRLTFQAHSAPLDSKFDATFSNLFVTLHGSWNRQPATGYKLVTVPFTKGSSGYAPTAMSNTHGYTDIFYSPNVSTCDSNSCTRPVGLAFDKKGRLYMTSDSSGELFMLGRT